MEYGAGGSAEGEVEVIKARKNESINSHLEPISREIGSKAVMIRLLSFPLLGTPTSKTNSQTKRLNRALLFCLLRANEALIGEFSSF